MAFHFAIEMFHFRGPDIEGTDKGLQLEQMAGYQSIQNFRACVVLTADLHSPGVAGPPREITSNSAAMPLQLKMFHIRGPDIEGKRNVAG